VEFPLPCPLCCPSLSLLVPGSSLRTRLLPPVSSLSKNWVVSPFYTMTQPVLSPPTNSLSTKLPSYLRSLVYRRRYVHSVKVRTHLFHSNDHAYRAIHRILHDGPRRCDTPPISPPSHPSQKRDAQRVSHLIPWAPCLPRHFQPTISSVAVTVGASPY
jgi:hypothetical protein